VAHSLISLRVTVLIIITDYKHGLHETCIIYMLSLTSTFQRDSGTVFLFLELMSFLFIARCYPERGYATVCPLSVYPSVCDVEVP